MPQDNRLADLATKKMLDEYQMAQMYAQPQPDASLASLIDRGGNFIRNDQTGRVIELGPSQPVAPRFAGSPVDVFGQGRGYLDPTSGIIRGINKQGQQFTVQDEGLKAAQDKARADAEMRALNKQKMELQIASMMGGQGGQKAPSGYQFTPEGTLAPIPGGPADIKAQMAEQQKSQAAEQAALSSQQVLDQAAMLLQHPGRETATGASYMLGKIPGTSARGFNSQLETFKAQTFVPMVSALKGMGALSDAEGRKLSASVGALDPEMPEDEFKSSLQNIIKYLYDKGKAAGLNVVNPLGDTTQTVNDDITDLLNKYK